MGKRVEVREGESIEKALHRLKVTQTYEYRRWTKKRLGYYEKPSVLRRKREKMARIWSMMEQASRQCGGRGKSSKNCIHLFLDLPDLFARTGPANTAGR